MKKILITGGAGFIGSHLVEHLLQKTDAEIIVLDNFSLGTIDNLYHLLHNQSLQIVDGDIMDSALCAKLMSDVNYVVHLAALGSVPRSINDPLSTHQANVTGFLNVLTAAKNAGVKKMIYASSSAVYGDSDVIPRTETKTGRPLSPYALSKCMNEEYAELFSRVYDFKAIGLRFFNVFGERQNPDGAYAAVIPRFFKAAFENTAPEIYGDGTVSRDFTYVSNIVDVCVKALFTNTNELVYNVACGGSISVRELWNKIASISGTNHIPVFMPGRKGDVQQSMANISRTTADLNYMPSVEVGEGLLRTYQYYKTFFSSMKDNA